MILMEHIHLCVCVCCARTPARTRVNEDARIQCQAAFPANGDLNNRKCPPVRDVSNLTRRAGWFHSVTCARTHAQNRDGEGTRARKHTCSVLRTENIQMTPRQLN